MTVSRVQGWIALLVLLTSLATTAGMHARAQSGDELAALRAQVSRLYGQGKYADAVPLAERYVALAHRKHGENHTEYANAIAWLAYVYQAQDRYAEAERLYKRALTIREKALGSDHPDVTTDLSVLAQLYQIQGRYAEAAPILKRYLAFQEKARGVDHPDLVTTLDRLSEMYEAQSRFDEADILLKRRLTIKERELGPDNPNLANEIDTVAVRYENHERYAEAEPLLKRSLAIREKAFGHDRVEVCVSLTSLGNLYLSQQRYDEAEPLLKRSLAIREISLGLQHPLARSSLTDLARLYGGQGRFSERAAVLERYLAITESTVGPDHPDLANGLRYLAGQYLGQRQYVEAASLYQRVLSITEKVKGPDHPDVATALNILGSTYQLQGRYVDAEPLFKRSLAIREKTLVGRHPQLASSLNDLASLYRAQGRYVEAEPLYKRSRAIQENVLAGFERTAGPDDPSVRLTLSILASMSFEQADWAAATDYLLRAVDVTIRRVKRGMGAGAPLIGESKNEAAREPDLFWRLLKSAHRLSEADASRAPSLAGYMFEMAQWPQASAVAGSLTQMAARAAKGAELGAIVRERQDIVREWQAIDKLLITARSEPAERRNAASETELSGRLAAIDARISEIDRTLKDKYPEYAALAKPGPIDIVQVRWLLEPDEALVLFLDTPEWKPTPEETFLWVVTKTEARWVRSEVGTQSLRREVAALRCGLDYDGAWGVTSSPCSELLKVTYTPTDHLRGKSLPFDLARAHTLYKALFGEVEELIKGKHLLIVPSGALNALPFQVLVTEKPADPLPPTNAGYANVAWLGARNALTVLPAVSSLKALRTDAKASRATDAYIGFGNPLLTGPDGAERRAWDYQRCQAPVPRERTHVAEAGRAAALAPLLKGGLANVEGLRRQYPLPETAEELCAVARAQGITDPDWAVNLGARATEARVKALSADGTLARAKVVHFATHGLVAGETALFADNHAEPALLLTPPETATEEDDGLLTASEIAALKLDADWVILSACNTAAGDTVGGDALSGLARAFFYAGARALLVSHWYVDSEATVTLITKSFDALTRDPKIGRAEALRRAMQALIAGGDRTAHPAAWAPFVVVGEGGGGR